MTKIIITGNENSLIRLRNVIVGAMAHPTTFGDYGVSLYCEGFDGLLSSESVELDVPQSIKE